MILAPAVAAVTVLRLALAPGEFDVPAGEDSLAAIEAALAAARAAGPATSAVRLRGGVHRLRAPIRLGPGDSGLTLEAFPGESPVVSGAIPIAGFRETEVGGRRAFEASLPDAPWDRHQLFAFGKRRPRARSPKSGTFRFESVPDATAETPWHAGQTRARFDPGDLAPFSNAADVEIVALHFWVESRLPLVSIDPGERFANFGKRSVFRLTDDHGPRPARYYVENALECLTEPGEWCVDSANGRLLVLPLPGERAETFVAEAPVAARLLVLEGEAAGGRAVENVTVRGIAFANAAWTPFSGGPGAWPAPDVAGPPQAAVTLPAAVEWSHAGDSAFEKCSIRGVGGYGIALGEGCRSNRIESNDIGDLGGGGVKIGTTALAEDERLRTSGNRLVGNRVHDGGKLARSAVGVFVGHSGSNRIAWNDVGGFDYTGLSIGWSWGYGKSGAVANVIEFNRVHDIGRGVLSDMGGIYTLGVSPGTVIRGNVFHDVESAGYGGWGIYFDEGTTGVVAEGNVVFRTKSSGFHQHYGRENVVRRNVFAFGRESQVARTRAEDHLSFAFEENLVLWSEGALFSGNCDGPPERVRFDRNVYWNLTGAPARFPGGLALGEWRARGQDSGSILLGSR